MLREALRYRIPGSEVIWYDSIIDTGQLKWQNKPCEKKIGMNIFLRNYSTYSRKYLSVPTSNIRTRMCIHDSCIDLR